tara:strand:- start:1982 stop:2410 length:429 start_codon:yes stop_codon:yes gene_type:complete
MARQLRFKSGNVQVNMSNEVSKGFENIVNKLLPKTRAEIEKILDELEADAKSRWPVRKKKSGGSRNLMYTEVRITPNLELEAVIGNKAEYAWAIRVGVDPQNTGLNMDRRVADGLLWAPTRKASNKIAKVFADEIQQQMKRG